MTLWRRGLGREQFLLSLGLVCLIVLAWADLARRAGLHSLADVGHEMVMPRSGPGDVTEVAITAGMWGVMMAAMMVPAATPMILLFSTVDRKRVGEGSLVVPTGFFMTGYLLVWAAFSLLAGGAQWGLTRLMLLDERLAFVSPLLSGLVLVASGIYQFTPLKSLCLTQCQSPLDFLFTHWRDGTGGALQMGWSHGAYCLGCCWVLMLLLFVGGVMNLAWIALIAGFVLVERVIVRGLVVSRLAGGLLILWGVGLATLWLRAS